MRFYNDEFYVKSPDEMKARFRRWSGEPVTQHGRDRRALRRHVRHRGAPSADVPGPGGQDAGRALRRSRPRGAGEAARWLEPASAPGDSQPAREVSRAPRLRDRRRREDGIPFLLPDRLRLHPLRPGERASRSARGGGAPPARSSRGRSGSRRSIRCSYDLLFERFLNPERISMPDIDIDFCQARRGEVIEYVTKKYGRENVAQIVTFSQLKPKLAVRDVARVLSLPVALGDRIAKLVPDGPDVNFERALQGVVRAARRPSQSDESVAEGRAHRRTAGGPLAPRRHARGGRRHRAAPDHRVPAALPHEQGRDHDAVRHERGREDGTAEDRFPGSDHARHHGRDRRTRSGIAPGERRRPRPPAAGRREDLRALPLREDGLRLPVRLVRNAGPAAARQAAASSRTSRR